MNCVSTMIMESVGRVRPIAWSLLVCSIYLGREVAMVCKLGETTNAVGTDFGVPAPPLFLFVGVCAVSRDALYTSMRQRSFPPIFGHSRRDSFDG
jgi:hypothetical protein